MTETLKCISPGDGRLYAERPLATPGEADAALTLARAAQREWRAVPLPERAAVIGRAVDAFVARREELAEEISRQMGRPIAQSPGEIGGFEERARHMIAIAPEALATLEPAPKPGFTRRIRRVPHGVVLVMAPWNFPYLTAVNAIVPALMAGNAVILKHSAQTPLCAERFTEAFAAAGVPRGTFQHLHLAHDTALRLVGAAHGPDHVAFTGSVAAGRAVQAAAAHRFIGVGLELGGKDPAYVRADADLEQAVAGVVDGALFNSGQSCCGVERVYVARPAYDEFVERAAQLMGSYRLGDPRDPDTTLGPLVRTSAAQFVRHQVAEAVAEGARALVNEATFPASRADTPYLAPQLVVDVNHAMRLMREETFGPVLPVMAVDGDDEAVALMNDSDFGLTASVWTPDARAAERIGEQVETGTFFMNRCDYLDPALAWTGVKGSGRGCTLSVVGYEQLTRPMSFHLRTGH